MERLNKAIAASGLTSRRKADELILAGKVVVNGTQVTTLATQVDPSLDSITVEGRLLPKPKYITYMVNKPKGVVCSKVKQKNERIITELVPSQPPVYPVGRLDKESEGLILLTNDGTLAQRLTHPSYNHAKVYQVLARWQADVTSHSDEWIRQNLLKGVKLGDGRAKAQEVSVQAPYPNQVSIRLVVNEGRHHLIRRMCAVLGLDVLKLKRIGLASLQLGNLPSGKYRIINPEDYSLR